jgi:type 1 fimbria pilin
MKVKKYAALMGVALLLTTALSARAQETTGTITGLVTDQTGAILPGTSVVVKHVATARTQEVITNESGRYNATLLQPGTYEVTFSLSGFQPVVVKGIELHVNDRIEVNGKLGISQVSETVEVSAASSFVQQTPAVQNLMGSTQVQEARNPGSGRLERSVGRSRRRSDQHSEHLRERRAPERGQLARGRRLERRRRLQHHAPLDANARIDR